ncbi:MAG: RNA methyltransferase [Acidobacteriota bacterium]
MSTTAIILVRPQLGENIGATARAMLNCKLDDLRLVAPRDGWPNPAARAPASGADVVLDTARCFDSVAAAVADLDRVWATTARHRDMVKEVATPRGAARQIHDAQANGLRCGILFGPERTGLDNDDVALATAILHVSLNPDFSSLNLAQAVLLVAYSLLEPTDETPDSVLATGGDVAADHAAVLALLDRLIGALDEDGFFRAPEMRPSVVRNLHNFFFRARPTDQEVRTLHGVISILRGSRRSFIDRDEPTDD